MELHWKNIKISTYMWYLDNYFHNYSRIISWEKYYLDQDSLQNYALNLQENHFDIEF